jgi:putative membrane protein
MRLSHLLRAAPLALAASLACAGAWAGGTIAIQPTTTSRAAAPAPSAADRRFFKEAFSQALADVSVGQLAVRSATTAAVQRLGQQLVTDGTRQIEQLGAIGQKSGLRIPTQLDARAQATVGRLAKLQGTAFDDAFVNHVRRRGSTLLPAFQREAHAARSPDLRSYAQSEMGVLRDHVDQARAVGVASRQGRTQQPQIK